MILKNKKGFSLVEVIIAMTVIAIVSATALTIVLTSADNTRAAMYKADAQYLVADAIECFKVSATKEELVDALMARGDLNENDKEGSPVVLIMQESGYFVFIDWNESYMSIQVKKDDNTEDVVASAEYIKAGR